MLKKVRYMTTYPLKSFNRAKTSQLDSSDILTVVDVKLILLKLDGFVATHEDPTV